MFVDGVDSNANIALSAALRQQLQITECSADPYDRVRYCSRTITFIGFYVYAKLYFSTLVLPATLIVT